MVNFSKFLSTTSCSTAPLILLLLLLLLHPELAETTCNPPQSRADHRIRTSDNRPCFFPFYDNHGIVFRDCAPFYDSDHNDRIKYWCPTTCNFPSNYDSWTYCKFQLIHLNLPNCSNLANAAVSPWPSQSQLKGGLGPGTQCVFPFLFGGRCRYDCVKEDAAQLWCSTTDYQFDSEIELNFKFCTTTRAQIFREGNWCPWSPFRNSTSSSGVPISTRSRICNCPAPGPRGRVCQGNGTQTVNNTITTTTTDAPTTTATDAPTTTTTVTTTTTDALNTTTKTNANNLNNSKSNYSTSLVDNDVSKFWLPAWILAPIAIVLAVGGFIFGFIEW